MLISALFICARRCECLSGCQHTRHAICGNASLLFRPAEVDFYLLVHISDVFKSSIECSENILNIKTKITCMKSVSETFLNALEHSGTLKNK